MVLSVVAAAFILILPVELPDKTLFATLVLATRFAPLPVFVGVGTVAIVYAATKHRRGPRTGRNGDDA